MSIDESYELIHRFPKNSRGEEVWIGLEEFKGVRMVDLRVFYKHSSGEMRPSRKGFCVRWEDQLDDLLEGVKKFYEEDADESPETQSAGE